MSQKNKLKFFCLMILIFLGPFSVFATVLHQRHSAPSLKVKPESAPLKKTATPNRWKIKPPPYEINKPGKLINPYRQNILKGDYPILGQDVFFILTASNQTFFETRKLPVPSNVSANGPGRFNFFGNGHQMALQQNFKFTFELYKGNTAYKPREWELKINPVFNINYINTKERGLVNVNVARGTNRTQYDFALEEALFEYHLVNVSKYYDFIGLQGGIQPFTSDFRGFIFTDSNLGGRLFGNFSNNKFQWNVAAFDLLEKDTNSGLNTFDRRSQEVVVANLYSQDFLGLKGWTNEFSFHWNHDQASLHYDKNGALVRPDPLGAASPHRVDAYYAGWASDGHIGRFNLSHAFYFVFGKDQHNLLADRKVNIYGQMASAELSYDRNWYRFRGSFLYTSGDKNPTNDSARGFDTIIDAPKFAGAQNSFFGHQGIKLGGVNLTQGNSFVPNLRSSKTQGQTNFVNPGLVLCNLGGDLDILPTLKAALNVNYYRFVTTNPLELFLNQANIRKNIGLDYSLGFQYRPLLNNNIILNMSGAVFQPGGGFKDILTSDLLYQAFTNIVLTY